MPRASEYLLEGYTYHLTHRCHDRRFLLQFARDRDAYREWLREGVRRHGVPVYAFCVTGNHVHVVAHADSVEAVSDLMHLEQGNLAREAHWTECLAVGSREFVERTKREHSSRWEFEYAQVASGSDPTWTVKEAQTSYEPI